jgi:hypothetical protein
MKEIILNVMMRIIEYEPEDKIIIKMSSEEDQQAQDENKMRGGKYQMHVKTLFNIPIKKSPTVETEGL